MAIKKVIHRRVGQSVIPKKVIKMAKFIQKCDSDKNVQGFVIIQKRNTGKTAAFNIARNNN